ncbi:MAG: hypothetical protein KME10_24695 [Plectolyngbya sp. WJT66-NPBG17]|jgi:hypothetical protein|nr:hypothetical protein [Plectolyngbya sp. WJT66-NPBG17]
MYRAGRHVDPEFEDDELLYNRCQALHVAEQRLLPTGIKFPDWSVNRSKYSEPDDVLIPTYLDWGIVEFQVDSVPKKLESLGNVVFEFKVEHDPVDDNYSHSEVRTYKEGIHHKNVEVNKTVKKQFRQMLSDRTRLIRSPKS